MGHLCPFRPRDFTGDKRIAEKVGRPRAYRAVANALKRIHFTLLFLVIASLGLTVDLEERKKGPKLEENSWRKRGHLLKTDESRLVKTSYSSTDVRCYWDLNPRPEVKRKRPD